METIVLFTAIPHIDSVIYHLYANVQDVQYNLGIINDKAFQDLFHTKEPRRGDSYFYQINKIRSNQMFVLENETFFQLEKEAFFYCHVSYKHYKRRCITNYCCKEKKNYKVTIATYYFLFE